MNKTALTYIILILLLFTSCKKESLFDCLKGSGKIVTEERDMTEFNVIEVKDIFTIHLSQDTFSSITIKGGENLLPLISTKVKDGILKLDDDNTCRWSRDYERIELFITIVELTKLELLAPSYIICEDTIYGDQLGLFAIAYLNEGELLLDYNYINFVTSHTAGGKMTLSGNVNSIRIENYYSTCLDAKDMSSNYADIMNKSIGDISVQCHEEMKVKLLNSGNIYYMGNPVIITTEHSGKGKLIKVD